ncbi:HEAT repeat domain-containing protein [Geomonas sp. RF6]|uniref:HEAT repeat domain-containing protein n=1 Tax=Geomonas sp. RF6 TaxID=2897342 RepID=UPI001E5E1E5A|nr:HEAT repeat domain-containing protein [Geomonas sp. RF6]UFS72238.1 HEAT repeat domain-containing protein [Geomonas sp. RF6]
MAAEAENKRQLKVVPPPAPTSDSVSRALTELHKAVKGGAFYPPGHPCRLETVQHAFEALQPLCAERELFVSVHRQGFTRGEKALEASPMLVHLARECLIRRIRSITFLRELRRQDLGAFIQLLNEEPHKVQGAGGMGCRIEQAGISTIKVNEQEIATLRDRELFGDPVSWESPAGEEPPEVEEIVRRMDLETDDGRYQELGRLLVVRVRQKKLGVAQVKVLERLLAHHTDSERTLLQCEYALFILEHLADGAAELLLDCLVNPDFQEKEGIHRILQALGGKGAYWIIQRVCLVQGLYERKVLAAALVHLGPRALPPLVAMLKDERWWVVRNMVAIIGELKCQECVPALRQALAHEDLRVKREAIRALMKCGGSEAEGVLVKLLEDQDEGVLQQAIICLGLMRSRQAVPHLLRLLEKRDLLLKDLAVKKEVLGALGRIGDRRATAPLLRTLSGWLSFGRREELAVAAASALGTLGDETALPVLRKKAAGGGRLAVACGEAVEGIERLFGGHHE